MDASIVMILFIVGIVVSIFIGNKFKFSVGLGGIVFAYLIAVYGLGMKTSDVINLWPTKIMFIIISITWFFGYANANGTLTKITQILAYRFRHQPKLLPWVFFLISGCICMTGASPYAPNAVLMPLIIPLSMGMGLNPLFGATMVNVGSYFGAQVPWGQGASIQRGVIESGALAGDTQGILLGVFLSNVLFSIISGVILFIVFKGWKANHFEDESLLSKPEPMTSKQKQTLALILLLVVLMVVPSLLGKMGIAVMNTLSSKLDISFVAFCLAFVCGLLKLGNDKEVIVKHIPWGTIMMLCGICTLVNVAVEGGAIELIGSWVGSNVPVVAIAPMMTLLAAFMSVFAAGAGVVDPTLFALVPDMAAAQASLNYNAVYSGICVGANASAVSPFSGGGSLTLANVKDEKVRDSMFLPLIGMAVFLSILAAICSVIGVFSWQFHV